jgi:hypothetical protein
MKQLGIYIGLLIFLMACRGTKKIQQAVVKKDTATTVIVAETVDSVQLLKDMYAKINSNRIEDFKTFKAKIKLDYEGKDNKNVDATAHIRLQKDSLIWVSITGLLGIEGLRVMITPDSVKLMNKLDDYYSFRSIGYLQELTELPFDFQTLQDIIIGNPVYVDSNIVSFKKNGTELQILSVGQLFRNLITLGGDQRIYHCKLDDVDQLLHSRTCDITYEEYEMASNGLLISTKREIIVSERSRLDIKLKYKDFSFNETLTFPFKIPKNYKRR